MGWSAGSFSPISFPAVRPRMRNPGRELRGHRAGLSLTIRRSTLRTVLRTVLPTRECLAGCETAAWRRRPGSQHGRCLEALCRQKEDHLAGSGVAPRRKLRKGCASGVPLRGRGRQTVGQHPRAARVSLRQFHGRVSGLRRGQVRIAVLRRRRGARYAHRGRVGGPCRLSSISHFNIPLQYPSPTRARPLAVRFRRPD